MRKHIKEIQHITFLSNNKAYLKSKAEQVRDEYYKKQQQNENNK